MKMKKFISIVLPIFLLFSCSSLKVEKTSFNGMIYDADNEPVSGAKIYIDDKIRTVSDMYGRFYIDDFEISKKYKLKIEKLNYETVIMETEVQNITQVAYITLYSSDQLLRLSEKFLTENNIPAAESYINRSEKCFGETKSSKYLRAGLLYKSSDYKNALICLSELYSKDDTSPYIVLFMADIYEYYLQDFESAKKYLEKYLSLNYDPEIEKRYSKLCAH